ncbi:MAG: glycosyl transferase group 1 [Chloroflexi bacterium]|nr:glycosyl transferase group 1 [Chloroflexota bacterium]
MVTRSNHRLAEELAALPGIELTVVAPTWWREESREVTQEVSRGRGYKLFVLPILHGKRPHPNLFVYRRGLGRILRQGHFDIIDCYEEPCSLAMAQMLALRALWSPNSNVMFYSAQNILKRYPPPFSWIERWTYRKAKHAHVCNSEVEQVLRAKGYTSKVHLLPLGVDQERFTPAEDKDAAKAALGLSGRVVGYVGRLHEEKGVRDLLQAFARLEMPEVTLLLVGDGPDRGHLEQQAGNLGVAEKVIFAGAVDRLLVPSYMQAMDCLVVPSRTMPNWKEQYGRIIIEAFLCGVPVIGSSSGSIPELIGDRAFVFPEGDVSELSRRLAELFCDDARRVADASAVREKALSSFTTQSVARQRHDIYRLLERQ